ncbi:DNA adenine methylase, partial [Clostridioides difficile]|uniref:DNA adenine methylase n=1 Tax=Clostridioides difficile TaxID=1496 RepID=UPI00190EA87D
MIIQKNSEQLKLFEADNEPLHINNRRYLGSKQKILDFINHVVEKNTTKVSTIADVFAGTGVVADMF